MRVWTLAVLLGTGCTSGTTETETAVETDDPDTDPDIPDTFLGRTSKPSDIERSGTALRAGLLRITPEEDGWWTAGNYLLGGKLTGTGNFALQLPEAPPDLDIGYLPGGREGALYLPLVYDDVNADDLYSDNAVDLILGYAENRWLVYLTYSPEGEDLGWSIVDGDSQQWSQFPLTEQADIRLYGLSAEARIEGIYEGARRDMGIVAIDERTLLGEGEGFPHFQALDVIPDPDTRQFDTTVDVRPPVPAFQFPDEQPRYVRALLQQYDDVNGDEMFSVGVDTLPGIGLCYKGEPLVVRYLDTPRSLRVARQIQQLKMTTGWRFVTGDWADSTEVSRNDLRWYRYDDECRFDDE